MTEYLESNDGFLWRKPRLGLYQIDGALTLDCGLTYRREPALLRINLENVTSAEYEPRGFGAASVIPATRLTFRATLGYSL